MLGFSGPRFIEGRVLVIEDVAECAEVIGECLTRVGAEIVGPVSTPAAALQILQHERVDAVLFDADRAGENEAAVLVQELDVRQVPSLMLNGEPLPVESRLHMGRAEMLWPFSEAALQAMVRQLVLTARRELPSAH